MSQQYLPFTVLKLNNTLNLIREIKVATVLTVYGIETLITPIRIIKFIGSVATVLTVYGIETCWDSYRKVLAIFKVATVLTVYGIETEILATLLKLMNKSQQYLPFTVLKRSYYVEPNYSYYVTSQQYLPFTVLKLVRALLSQ